MKKFNKNAACVKCGSRDIMNTFWDKGDYVQQVEVQIPYIHRYCQNCQYTWHERPLDYEELENNLEDVSDSASTENPFREKLKFYENEIARIVTERSELIENQ